jgi:hypothetical protein
MEHCGSARFTKERAVENAAPKFALMMLRVVSALLLADQVGKQ